jgi:hypothetical protein
MFFQASMGIPDGKAGKATTKNSPENFNIPVKLWKRHMLILSAFPKRADLNIALFFRRSQEFPTVCSSKSGT